MAYAPSIRLYTDHSLYEKGHIELDKMQSHYLTGVMRCKVGDSVCLFNGQDGEFVAKLMSAKKTATLEVGKQIKKQELNNGPTLFFAPLKKTAQDFLVEKATELDVAVLQPVITQRTVNQRVNLERMHAIAREASEQCERTTVPLIVEPIKFSALQSNLNKIVHLFVGDERRDSQSSPLISLPASPAECGVFIGPEGGFTPEEFASLARLPVTRFMSLGRRVLRAETAALSALSIIGQWR